MHKLSLGSGCVRPGSSVVRSLFVWYFPASALFCPSALAEAPVRIAGSWSAYASQSETAAVFEKKTGVGVAVAGANNVRGVDYLLSGRIDVLMWTPTPGVTIDKLIDSLSMSRRWRPVVVSPGRFAALVLVHEDNPIHRLTYAQLQDIFSGNTKKWAELGGQRGSIRVVAEADGSKGHEIFANQVMASVGFGGEIGQGRDLKEVSAIVAKDRNAIGFCLDSRQPLQGVRAIGLSRDGNQPFADPSEVSILSRRYPLVEDVFLIAPENGDPRALEYCRFACGSEASDIAKKWNLYSNHEWEALLKKDRLSELRAGRGVPVSVGAPASLSPLMSDLGARFSEDQSVVQVLSSPTKLGEDERKKFLGGSPEILAVEGPSVSDWTTTVKSVELGWRHLGVIVNPGLGLKSLSIAEIREICSGKVKKWARGAEQGVPIKGYGPASDAPCMSIFRDLVAAPSVLPGASNSRHTPIRLARRKSTEDVIDSVANDTAGIGFVDLSEMKSSAPSVVVLEVLDSVPTEVRHPVDGGSSADGATGTPVLPNSIPGDDAALPRRFPLIQKVSLYLSPEAGPSSERLFEWLERELPGDSAASSDAVSPGTRPPKSRIVDALAKHGIVCPSR